MKTQDIQSFSDSLASSMQSRLDTLSEEKDATTRYLKCMFVISESILNLRQFVRGYCFQHQEEEIAFFKEIKPRFVAQYHYYKRLITLKSNEPIFKDQKVSYYTEAMESIRQSMNEEAEFNYYRISGQTSMDEKYFMRGNLPSNDISSDRDFSTWYDDRLSKLLAMQLLTDEIQKELLQLSGEQPKSSTLTWTGSKTDLVELIYGLESIGAFNKGKADLKEIAQLFEVTFNITLGNYYRQFLDIKLRKKGKTIFLDEMREKLEIRINDFQ